MDHTVLADFLIYAECLCDQKMPIIGLTIIYYLVVIDTVKNGFFLVAFTAILLTGTLASQVYGQSFQITIETDKDMYSPGETITVSGIINKLTSNEEITMLFREPNGNFNSADQIIPAEDNTWSTQIKLSPKAKAGIYTISVLYGKWANEATLTVGQGTAIAGTAIQNIQPAITPEGTLVFDLEGTGINYKITGGSIKSIYPDVDSNSLIIEIDATDNGMLTISLPRAVIDSDIESNLNGDFFVLVDNEENDYEETETTETYRTLNIEFYAGSEIIEIIGTMVIPEFGIVAIVVLAVSLVSIIAITSRSKLTRL